MIGREDYWKPHQKKKKGKNSACHTTYVTSEQEQVSFRGLTEDIWKIVSSIFSSSSFLLFFFFDLFGWHVHSPISTLIFFDWKVISSVLIAFFFVYKNIFFFRFYEFKVFRIKECEVIHFLPFLIIFHRTCSGLKTRNQKCLPVETCLPGEENVSLQGT